MCDAVNSLVVVLCRMIWTYKSIHTTTYKINFAEHARIFNTHHTNLETNLEILHILSKGSKLNTTEQYEIYKHYKQSQDNILNDELHYKTHTLFDIIIQASRTNISATPSPKNRKTNFIATRSMGTNKYRKWCTWHRNLLLKNSSEWRFCVVKWIK